MAEKWADQVDGESGLNAHDHLRVELEAAGWFLHDGSPNSPEGKAARHMLNAIEIIARRLDDELT